MSYSKRQLYALGETLGEVTRKEAGVIIYGSGGGGGGTSTSSTQASIAPEFKPLLNLYTQQAQNIAGTPYTPYSGQRYADLNATQNAGIGMIQDRALNGDPTVNSGANYLQGMLNSQGPGAAINPLAQVANPYLDAMVNSALGKTKGQVNSQFSGSNYGTTAHQGTLADSLSGAAAGMYGNAYNTLAQLQEAQAGRTDAMNQNNANNRLNAAQLGLNYGNQAYQNAGQLLNAGNLQQQQAQNNLDFGYNQFQEASNYPFKQLQATGNVVGQGIGSTTTGKTSGGGK